MSDCPLSQAVAITGSLIVFSCKNIIPVQLVDCLYAPAMKGCGGSPSGGYIAVPYGLYSTFCLKSFFWKDLEYIGWRRLGEEGGTPLCTYRVVLVPAVYDFHGAGCYGEDTDFM